MSRKCDAYSIPELPGVTFCRKAGAQVVHEKLERLSALEEAQATRDQRDGYEFTPVPLKCRACGRELLAPSSGIADCCPCNSPRGVNHGLVPPEACTCDVCDPARTGSSRAGIVTLADLSQASIEALTDDELRAAFDRARGEFHSAQVRYTRLLDERCRRLIRKACE